MSIIDHLVRLASNGAVLQIGPGEGAVPFKVTVTDGNWEIIREGLDLPTLFAQAVSLWDEHRASCPQAGPGTGPLVS